MLAKGEGGEKEYHVQGGKPEQDIHAFICRGAGKLEHDEASQHNGGEPAKIPVHPREEESRLLERGIGRYEESHGKAAGAFFAQADGECTLAG